MNSIDVSHLSKGFKTLNRREGLGGAIKDLFSQNYTQIQAVDNISFSLKKGEIVGFVGPNGAGKSTTIKMLTGVLQPDAGNVAINGLDPFTDRKKNAANIGVVFGQRSQLWWDLPVIESFKILKEIYRIENKAYLSMLNSFNELVDLKELYGKPVRTLSLGQKMLCDIAAAFLHNPGTIFLDEPTIGLDISVKNKIRILIKELNRHNNTTIILTTHDISDIEALCRRIIIIDKGKIIYDGETAKVKSLLESGRVLKLSFENHPKTDYEAEIKQFCLNSFPENSTQIMKPDEHWIYIEINEKKMPLLNVLNAIAAHFPVKDIKVEEIETTEIIRKVYEGALQ